MMAQFTQVTLAQLGGLGAVSIGTIVLGLLILGLILAIPFLPLFLSLNLAKVILDVLGDIYASLKKVLSPSKWDSWQVLIWISVFSWAMSLLPEARILHAFIASVGWLFLIPGVHWFLHEEKLKLASGTELNIKKGLTLGSVFIGPWITGALVCIFLFGGLAEGVTDVGWVCWPPISAAIAVAPKFIQMGPKYGIPAKADDRQDIILTILMNLILSCWIQLYFSTQYWLAQYPSLLATDLSKSAFVIQLNSSSRISSRGETILQQACNTIETELRGQSWSRVERWLLDLDQQLLTLQSDIIDSLSDLEENQFWRLQGRAVPGTEYAIKLFALWNGPTVDGKGYYLTQPVFIRRAPGARVPVTAKVASDTTTGLAEVQCGEITGPASGQPTAADLSIDADSKKGGW